MSLRKTVNLLFGATFFSLFFVFLQTQIIALGYCVQSKKSLYQQLTDENDNLRYDISRLESLETLNKRISYEKAAYELPRGNQLVKISVPKNYSFAKNTLGQKRGLFNLLGLQSEAEAKQLR